MRGRDGLGVWDGNVVKLGCDYGCTTINIIKFIKFKKKNRRMAKVVGNLKIFKEKNYILQSKKVEECVSNQGRY